MHSRAVAWLAAPAVLLLIIPFAALLQVTPWGQFHLAYGDGDAVRVSLGYSVVSMVLIMAVGAPLALWLARSNSRAVSWVHLLVLVPLVTPPLAMGILLVTAYGPYGTAGTWLTRLGVALTNNPAAFVLAQVYGGLPYFVVSARSAFESVPRAAEESAWTLGATRWQTFWRVTVPEAGRGLASGLTITWVRVIGEFGIVLIFAYFPQGLPVKLYVNLQNDGVDSVYTLVWILLIVTLPLPLWCVARLGKVRIETEGL